MRSPTRWITAANGILGLWLIAAPFVLRALAVDQWNDPVVGAAIVVLSGYNYYCERTQGTVSQRAAAITSILGGWLIVAPFVYGLSGIALWNNVCVGVVVTSFGGYNVYAAPRIQQTVTSSPSEEI